MKKCRQSSRKTGEVLSRFSSRMQICHLNLDDLIPKRDKIHVCQGVNMTFECPHHALHLGLMEQKSRHGGTDRKWPLNKPITQGFRNRKITLSAVHPRLFAHNCVRSAVSETLWWTSTLCDSTSFCFVLFCFFSVPFVFSYEWHQNYIK